MMSYNSQEWKKKKNASESASTSSEAVHFKPQTEAIKKQGTTTSNQWSF